MNYKYLPNTGYYQTVLKDYDIVFLQDEINQLKKDFLSGEKFNEKLAGNIKHEYLLGCNTELEKLILPLISNYNDKSNILSNYNIMSSSLPLYLDTAWVNFQHKYEFNPSHNHEGVLSFVIWIDIPYTTDDETLANPGANSNIVCSGNFEFQYTDILGQIRSYKIPCNNDMNNTILIFPSKMVHCVYPFFSTDKYRVSVSGNFKLKV